jgi:hypothetical protein
MAYITISGDITSQRLGSQMCNFAMLYSISKITGHEIAIVRDVLTQGHGLQLLTNVFDTPVTIIDSISQPCSNIGLTLDPAIPLFFNINNLDKQINYHFSSGLLHFEFLYFLKHLFEIRNTFFKFKDKYLIFAKNIIRSITKPDQKTISLHFRRTDYLTCGALNLSENYYIAAVEAANIPDAKLIIFSDDIEFCKNNLSKLVSGRDVYFAEFTDHGYDMQLMSLCDVNIIANSTFSLWGALLNDSTNMMICPRYEMIPPRLNLIDSCNGYKNCIKVDVS